MIPTPTGFRLRGRAALALTALALAACLAAIIGIAWPFSDRTPIPVVLLDRSASVSGDSTRAALQVLLSELHARYEIAEADVIEFAEYPSSALRVTTAGTGQQEPSPAPAGNGTDLAAALEQAVDLASSAEGPPRPVFVIGDGYATRGSTTAALRAATAAGIVPRWIPIGQDIPTPRIAEVLLPDLAGLGEQVEVIVRLADLPTNGSAQRVSITSVNPRGDSDSAAADVSGEGIARLAFTPRVAGPVLLNVALQDSADGTVLDERPLAAVIEVMPAADLLYVGRPDAAVARSLVAGNWSLDVVSPRALSGLHEQLGAYSAVILDEVPVAAADQRLWDSLLAAVRSEGTGLLVLGGSTAFAAGGYRGSTLEGALPVLSEPAALRESTAVVFAVDKSGSMGEGTAGIDRFQLARQAVLETVADMSEADRVALVAFDVEARTLLAMSEATRAKRDLAGTWPVRAAGGTSLVPALEAAMAQLESGSEDRRLLVLVTDGFLDDVPIEAWRRRLDAAGVELLAFAIGPDARLDELRRLAGTSWGRVIRVEQAAELPGLMRSTVERQRAVIERGTIQLRPLVSVDFMESGYSAWPDIEAYTVTRAREDATVWVESNKGDPVIASQAFGLGRVVAVTTSVPEWTPGWADWPSWPRLAAGLLDYVSRRPMHSKLWLGTESDADSMAVTVDFAEGTDWAGEAEGRLLVTPPAGPEFAVELRSVAPGRLAATLENPLPGVYRFMAEIGADRVGSYQLHRVPGELERIGVNPELERWESEGLLRRWKGDGKEALAAGPARDRDGDRRSWTLLAVALFLLGVLVDRVDLNGRVGIARIRALSRRRLSAPAP